MNSRSGSAGSGGASAAVIFERTVAEAVRRTKVEAKNDPVFVGSGLFRANGTGTILRTIQSKLDGLALDVLDYGIIGLGDETDLLQQALDDGALQNRVVHGGATEIPVTGPLTLEGPGLIFERAPHGDSGGPGLYPTGSGYTVLTVTGITKALDVTIHGTGATLNGIHLNNPILSTIQNLRVRDLDGFGVKIEQCFDSVFNTISVEECGNATGYAFSLIGGAGTSNHTKIGRLQVELANKKAILIDGSTLAVSIDTIHSERATADPLYTTWDIGGARSTFDVALFTATVPADASLSIHGEHSTYTSFSAQGAIAITLSAETASSMTMIQPNFDEAEVFIDTNAHSGLINLQGGTIGTLNVDCEADKIVEVLADGTQFGIVALGDVGGNPGIPELALFIGCRIDEVTSTTTHSAATFINCNIAEGNDLGEYRTVLINTTVTCVGTLNVGGTLIVQHSTINGNVLVGSGATLLGTATRFNGNLEQTTACSSLLDAGCYCTGTVTGIGVPTVQPSITAQVGQVWRKGQRHHNLAPAVGQPTGWICTTAGGNGVFTFTAEANLGGSLSHTLTPGTHLSVGGGGFDGSADKTLVTDATNANTGSTIVARDGSGNFSAGTITANLTGNASGSSGSCTGNAATATTATNQNGGSCTATQVNNSGDYFQSGTKVLSSRRTGWSAATGSATRTTFDTTTVTTQQLAERVKALLDDLIAHGAIGA